MAMDRLGSDLQKILDQNGGRFQKATVLRLGVGLVRSPHVDQRSFFFLRLALQRSSAQPCLPVCWLSALCFRWLRWSTSTRTSTSTQTSKLPTSCWATGTPIRLVHGGRPLITDDGCCTDLHAVQLHEANIHLFSEGYV